MKTEHDRERQPVLSEQGLHRIDLQIPLGQELLEPGVLPLQVSELAKVVGLERGVLALPDVERIWAHAMVFADLCLRLLAASGLLQNPDDLLFGELGSFRGSPCVRKGREGSSQIVFIFGERTRPFGNPALKTAVKSRTAKVVLGALRTFFRLLVTEGHIPASPMEGVRPPIHRPDQIQPFTEEQVQALLKASKSSQQPRRDEALLLFMLDSGLRVSELCELDFQDVDVVNPKAIVRGKGNKHRAIYFSRETGRVLWRYLRERDLEPESPLFESKRGERLTRYGVRQILERLGESAKIEAVRCSPHTVRHTFAVMFLRAGGSVFTLKEMLGHTDLAMTNRYVTLAQADIQNQHRQFSPVQALKRRWNRVEQVVY